jgi:hypothetical protein
LNCRGNTEYKLPAEVGFVCGIVPATPAVIRPEIKDTLCRNKLVCGRNAIYLKYNMQDTTDIGERYLEKL